ncbi:MAG: copper chaperone PCu(A)C [Burkholderiales bacterium]|jgi:hypothetical protein|nr:copper chaperone PCu(A)C [Burkholderiales bacterium]
MTCLPVFPRRHVAHRLLGAALVAWALSIPAARAATGGTADVSLSGVWVRATVPGQPVAAAYGSITGHRDLKLVAVSSPLAKRAEVHEMSSGGDMMQMRAVPALVLAKGRTVLLAPGGLHVMLTGIGAPLKVGTTVPLTFTFERGRNDTFAVTVQAAVRSGDTPAPPPAAPTARDPLADRH